MTTDQKLAQQDELLEEASAAVKKLFYKALWLFLTLCVGNGLVALGAFLVMSKAEPVIIVVGGLMYFSVVILQVRSIWHVAGSYLDRAWRVYKALHGINVP